MQQRTGIERRRATDREPAKQMGGQPNPGEENDDSESPEQMRSPLTAQEFEHPRRRADDKLPPAAGRQASAGTKGGPAVTHRLEDE